MRKTQYAILVFFLLFVFTLSAPVHSVEVDQEFSQSNNTLPYRVVTNSIAVDGENSTYIAGICFNDYRMRPPWWSRLICIDNTSAGFSKTYNGGSSDGFVIKLDASGETIEYATYVGGSGGDWITSMALDEQGFLYVGGFTTSNEDSFPIGGDIPGFQTSHSGSDDGFLMKIDTKCDEIVYSTYLGGNSSDTISAIAVDSEGNVYAGGETFSTEDSFPIGGDIPGRTWGMGPMGL